MNKPWHDPMQKTCPGIAGFKLCQKKEITQWPASSSIDMYFRFPIDLLAPRKSIPQ